MTMMKMHWHALPLSPLLVLSALALSGCGEPDPEPGADGSSIVGTAATDGAPSDGTSAPEASPGDDPPDPTNADDTGGDDDGGGSDADTDNDPDATGDSGADGAGGGTNAGDGGTEDDDATGTASDDGDGEGNAPRDPSTATAEAELRDCASTLPCRLESADGTLAVTLSAADGEALDGSGPLRVDFAVEALSRDMTLDLEPRTSAIAAGQVLSIDTLRLGDVAAADARDEASSELLAGVPVNGHAIFAGTLVGNPPSLDRLTLALREAGAVRDVAFANVPLGAEPSAPIDCEGALPCTWRSADGTATLALTEVAPLRWNRATRLVVSWALGATRAMEVVTYPAGRVTDADGVALEIYGVELAGAISSDGTPLSHPLDAGDTLDGRFVLRRAPVDGATRLARVEPGIGERRALRAPRWRPVFLDVPIAP